MSLARLSQQTQWMMRSAEQPKFGIHAIFSIHALNRLTTALIIREDRAIQNLLSFSDHFQYSEQ